MYRIDRPPNDRAARLKWMVTVSTVFVERASNLYDSLRAEQLLTDLETSRIHQHMKRQTLRLREHDSDATVVAYFRAATKCLGGMHTQLREIKEEWERVHYHGNSDTKALRLMATLRRKTGAVYEQVMQELYQRVLVERSVVCF
jgi:hypothetical protein